MMSIGLSFLLFNSIPVEDSRCATTANARLRGVPKQWRRAFHAAGVLQLEPMGRWKNKPTASISLKLALFIVFIL